MKTNVKSSLAAIALILLVVACGDSKSKLSNSQILESSIQIQSSVAATTEEKIKFDFENSDSGKLPEGWSKYYTGSGGTEWKVIDDKGNKVLAQLYSDNPNNHFNVAVNNSITAKDMALTVRLKGVAGKEDQGGGFIWRFIDKNNYYVVRANPLEDNMVLYKMENGKRSDLPLVGKGRTYGVDVPTMGSSWHTMKLIVKGDLFTIYMNGKELFKVQDSTFTKAGKVGLWTKADAVTYFDDYEIEKY